MPFGKFAIGHSLKLYVKLSLNNLSILLKFFRGIDRFLKSFRRYFDRLFSSNLSNEVKDGYMGRIQTKTI